MKTTPWLGAGPSPGPVFGNVTRGCLTDVITRAEVPASAWPEQDADCDSLTRGLEERDLHPLPVVPAQRQEAAGHERPADIVSGANDAAGAAARVQGESCREEVAARVVREDRCR